MIEGGGGGGLMGESEACGRMGEVRGGGVTKPPIQF